MSMNYETKGLLYAEKYGIINYQIKDNTLVYPLFHMVHTLNLDTMQTFSREVYPSFKGRTVMPNQKVKVYYNLHKKCFSIMDYATKLVIAHADKVRLENVTFEVNETGRQKVIAEKRKNVHAYVVGTLKFDVENSEITHNENAYYNPYVYSTFVTDHGNILRSAKSVVCSNKKITFARN